MSDDNPMSELSLEQCWDLLTHEELGRLAFTLVDEVRITPVNYAVDGRTLLIRTNAGEKLFAAAVGREVAFEIDHHDENAAWSVVARGPLRILEEHEEHRAEDLPLRPWVTTPKYDVVEIAPTVVTGRAFRLSRPWLHLGRPGPATTLTQRGS